MSWGGGSAGGTDHILIGLIAKAVGVDPAKINYVAVQGRRRGGRGDHRRPRHRGRLRPRRVRRADQGRAACARSRCPRRTRIEGIPSLKEQGIDVELGNWRGVFGAPGITPAQRDALVKLVQGRDRDAGVEGTLEKLGWTRVFLGGDQFKTFLDEDTKRIAAIIDSLGIKKK